MVVMVGGWVWEGLVGRKVCGETPGRGCEMKRRVFLRIACFETGFYAFLSFVMS